MYYYISTPKDLERVIRWVDTHDVMCFDTETGPSPEYEEEWAKNSKVGLNPRKASIATFQIGDEETQWIIDARVGLDTGFLKDLLEDETKAKIGVNLKFDAKMIMQHYDIIPTRLIDCMLMEQVIRCGVFPGGQNESAARVALKYTSMAALSAFYLGEAIDKDKDLRITLWKTPPNEFDKRQLEYMAGDCIYPHRIAKEQVVLIRERGLEQVMALEHAMIPVLADMELTGIPFDRPYWIGMLQDNVVVREKCVNTLNDYLQTHSLAQGNMFGPDDIVTQLKFDSPQKLAKALAAVGFKGFVDSAGNALSTSSERLKLMKIEGRMPADLIDAILDYRRVEKRITSYGGNFLKSVDSVTGRIHPDFTQTILVTGRMSCSPGMQTIPGDATYRRAFDSPEGWCLIVLDASQIEARISADATGDRPAIEIFQNGGDIYKEDGEAFYNTAIDRSTEEGEKLRNRAKASWLGLSYGQGKNKFHTYSRLFLGEDIAKEDTDFLYERFFEVHWRMKEVMDEWSSYVDPANSDRYIVDRLAPTFINEEKSGDILLKALTERTYGDEKKAQKQLKRLLNNKHKVRYAETILGRKRFFRADFLGWWTAGRNMPIQGTAADIQKATMLAFQNLHWENNFDAHIINVVHDEIITLVKEDQAEDLYEQQIKIGEAVGQRFLQHVPMKVDGGITKHWKKF